MRTTCLFLLLCGALALDLPNNAVNFSCNLTSQARGQSCTTTFDGNFNTCVLPDGFWVMVGFPPDAPSLSLYMGTSATYLSGKYAFTFMATHRITHPYHSVVPIESFGTSRNVIYMDPSNPQVWSFSATSGEKCSMARTQSVCSTPTLNIQVIPDYKCPQPYYMSLFATRPDGTHSTACVVDWNPGVSYISFMQFNTDSDWKDVVTVDCN